MTQQLVQAKTTGYAVISELLIAIGVLAEVGEEIRIVAGVVGIILGTLTIWKISLEIRLKRRELREKEGKTP